MGGGASLCSNIMFQLLTSTTSHPGPFDHGRRSRHHPERQDLGFLGLSDLQWWAQLQSSALSSSGLFPSKYFKKAQPVACFTLSPGCYHGNLSASRTPLASRGKTLATPLTCKDTIVPMTSCTDLWWSWCVSLLCRHRHRYCCDWRLLLSMENMHTCDPS